MPSDPITLAPFVANPPNPVAELMTTPVTAPAEPLIEADELVEDISIDGMCGVY
jgi:mycofactocin precursor